MTCATIACLVVGWSSHKIAKRLTSGGATLSPVNRLALVHSVPQEYFTMTSSSLASHSDALSARAYAWMLTLTVVAGLELGLLLLDISPILPLVRQRYAVDYVAAGWAISVTLICHTLAVTFAGFIAGRTGPRPLLLTGLALGLISSVMRALAPTFLALLASRAVTGMGTGCIVVGGVTAITVLSPPRRRVRDQGYFGAAQQLGIMLTLLTAPVGVRQFGMAGYWEIFAGELAVVLLVFALTYPRRHPQAQHTTSSGAWLVAIARDGYGWLLSLTNMAGYGAFVGVTGWTASFLILRYHTSPAQTAVLSSGAALFAFIGRLAASPLLRVMNEHWLMGGFTALTALSLGAIPFAPNEQIASLLLLVFALGSSVPFGVVFGSIASRPAPAGVSRRIMMVMLNSNIAALALPLVIGYTVSLTNDFSVGFCLTAALVGLVALVILRSSLGQAPSVVTEAPAATTP